MFGKMRLAERWLSRALLLLSILLAASLPSMAIAEPALPSLSINDVTVTEGGDATFTVTLSQRPLEDVTFRYVTHDGTAIAPQDYIPIDRTVVTPKGPTVFTLKIKTVDNAFPRPSKTFFVNISGVYGATLGDGQGIGTIINDDAQPMPEANSVQVPKNGTYGVGKRLNFIVFYDQDVYVDTSGGTPRIPLTIGGETVYAYYNKGSGTHSITFTYAVQAGDNDADGITLASTLDLNGGTVNNSEATPVDIALNGASSTAGVLVNTVQPTVLSTKVNGNPSSNAASVTFQIVFSEAVTGLTAGDLTLAKTGTADAALSGLLTSDNITYTVTASDISGSGTLRLDVPASGLARI